MAQRTRKTADKPVRWSGLYSAGPNSARCSCGVQVHASWVEGFPVRTDREDLSPAGEAIALMLGLVTYVASSKDGRLSPRTVSRITRRPDPWPEAVRREHRCGLAPPLPEHRRVQEKGSESQECPF